MVSPAPSRPASTIDPTGEFPLDLTSYVFHLFAVVSRHREARLEAALKAVGVSLSRHRALSVIFTMEPCTMSELADYSAVDRTTLTRTVDQLVDGGLVERTTPREDRRQVVLTLTDQGRRTCRRSLQAIYGVSRDLLVGLAEKDQRVVARSLETILARLVDDPDMLRRLTLRDGGADR
ncbi:MAG TPA: MarR family transcriptional regulator [Caulobacteraceae bacterium]|nr:MarR family transcriptional regulator [Caulobacteraceae bacterium]